MIDVVFIKPHYVAFSSIYHKAGRPENSSTGASDVMLNCFVSDEKMQ